ncbi:MAG: (E)-4-hydroxy-3-methylbut-2-enyl-diphosphate synthase [Bacteroidales bacterium]
MQKRFRTREVRIGNTGIGGNNPVRIQSMTNINTLQTDATVDQCIRLADAGCELVRITAQGSREAAHLAVIKQELSRRGYHIPLIADIHFNPGAAEIAAAIVEKVRINPGNYTDRNRGKVDFSHCEYEDAVERIRERIRPLIRICKQHQTVMRIGSNHGSLSERIVSRYGNTPEGMVEAALEFVRICRDEDFHNLVLSMKASNVRVMVHATRLLVKRMMDEGMDYPLHLGVTEAGDGLSGRIKSAAGIGALLADGLGDTIRVSLTEPPENEIPVAQKIISYFENPLPHSAADPFADLWYPPFEYTPRKPDTAQLPKVSHLPLVAGSDADYRSAKPDVVVGEKLPENWKRIDADAGPDVGSLTGKEILLLESTQRRAVYRFRDFFRKLDECSKFNPVILKKFYNPVAEEDSTIDAALDFAPLFLDGFGDGIWLDGPEEMRPKLSEIAFEILQATGARISKTEYIACPSCGRTQYDIQKSLQEIKIKTAQLPGLKIAVMGCIVNGPGEMADADYGYVGMGAGKVALFRGKQMVRKNVDESEAVDTLIALIRENGDWRE